MLKLKSETRIYRKGKKKDVINECIKLDFIYYTLALWQQMTDAETISFTFCFSLMIVFKFIAVTTTGGISEIFFEEVET